MTSNTREDAAARIAARGEEVTLGAIFAEQSRPALEAMKLRRPEKLKITPTKKNQLTVRRVGKIEK